MQPELELIETADVAKILNCTPENVRVHARAGHLPVALTTPRGGRLFDREAVERFKEAREARASARGVIRA